MKKIAYISIFIGIIYYLISPVLIVNYECTDNFPYIDINRDLMMSFNRDIYFIFLGIFIIIFYIIFSVKKNKLAYINKPMFEAKKLPLLSYVVLLSLQLFAYYNLKDILFKGYLGFENIETNEYKAIICGVNIIYSFFYSYYYISNQKMHSNYFLLQLMINSVVLLGSGSRIYVLTVILVIFYTTIFFGIKKYRKYQLLKNIMMVLLVALGVIYIGIWRQNLSLDFSSLCFYIFAESYLIWMSGGDAIVNKNVDFLNFPYDLFISLIGILPTLIFPFKFEIMEYFDVLLNTTRLELYSPLGGTSIIYTLLSNFGIFGLVIAFISISILIRKIYIKSMDNCFYSAYYIVFCSIIPFIMFREGFFHIFKNTIFNGFLMPYILINLSFGTVYLKKKFPN